MSTRICYLCGKPATGFASSWTPSDGERAYCHGDDDERPTCYERHGWAPLTAENALKVIFNYAQPKGTK